MSDPYVPRQVEGEYFFVNNCFGAFYRGVLDWVADDFYPRFEYKVIGTYDKSVEFFNKKKELGHEVESPLLPSVTLDPTYDFSPEERGGRFLWQTRHLAPGMGARIFNSIDLKDQDVVVTPVFSRYQGTFELIFWLSSVYELLDFRTLLLQYTGGYNRWIRPKTFWSFIILPDEIKNFKDENGTPLDWGNTDATFIHIDNINQTKFAHPILLNPIFKLDSLNDNSTKYGGDQIAEYKLSATMTYEIELPTYMVLRNKVGITLQLSFGLGNVYTKYGAYQPKALLDNVAAVDNTYSYDISHMVDYRIPADVVDNAARLATIPTSVIWPSEADIIDWNPIYSGRLVKVTDANWEDVDFIKGDILYCNTYDNKWVHHLRRSIGSICRRGGVESELYRKATILKNPVMTHLGDEFANLDDYIGQDITVDLLNKTIYLGIQPTEEIYEDDAQFGYRQLKYLKDNDPNLIEEAKEITPSSKFMPSIVASAEYDKTSKQVVIGLADGIETVFTLPYTPEYPDRTRIYVDKDILVPGLGYTISGNIVTLTKAPVLNSTVYAKDIVFIPEELKLVAVYEFSTDDLENDSDEYIEIDLPFQVESVYDLIVLSYNGILDYERDYELDLETMKLTLKLKPRSGELIEFFQIKEYHLVN